MSINYQLAQQGGLKLLASIALPSLSTSQPIFAQAPDGLRAIKLTLRTAGITMRSDGNAATAGANGLDYAVGTYALEVSKSDALNYKAIQNGGTVTGWVEYYGF